MADHANGLIDRLIQGHAVEQLRSYSGNLYFAIHVIQNNWLPDENEPRVRQHIETLQQYLAKADSSEVDGFLLRLGLTAPGMRRGIIPPILVLEENRGGFSARRLREAEGQISRLQEVLVICQRFFPHMGSDSQRILANSAKLIQSQPSPNDTDWLNWYEGLTSPQAEKLALLALAYLDDGEKVIRDIGIQILQQLSSFRQEGLGEAICSKLVKRGQFWPSSLYRDSGDVVAAELVSRIETAADSLSLNHLLLALAWTRSAVAHQAFQKWRHHQPDWASELHVPPEEYTLSAGWCLEDNDQTRSLISERCYRLLPVEEKTATSISCRIALDEQCPTCGGPLASLFDLSSFDAEFFSAEFAEAPRKAPYCPYCSCFEPVFTTYRGDETWEWLSPLEVRENPDRDEQIMDEREVEKVPCPAFAYAEPFGLNDASTLGGVPMWLQDVEYPRCIQCGRVMTFLGQHDNGTVGEEGISYAFFCALCHTCAVSYQQT